MAAMEVASTDSTITTNKTEIDPLANLVPKKLNWDLKRDVNKKLEKLNRRTQRAILEILQSRAGETKQEEESEEDDDDDDDDEDEDGGEESGSSGEEQD
eukprot:gnl/Hemi2/4708_TR1628_c0_g1_i1.p1 gnl/Hemi2/4708_TR1628_c0_g1~~gnl/Hemi2/4708_TR1628_c0_g1_i1.p1  ORF type:complete len:113 (+),score=39.80 gnl/Hemi2/4708_TR1628_c0_g1_i1:44-340(+)